MPRYIDADGLKEALRNLTRRVVKNGDKHNEGFTYDQVFFCIDARPAADVVERKKGKWIIIDSDEEKYEDIKCPNCKMNFTVDACRWCDIGFTVDDLKFCPNCGAEMRGEE